MPLISMFAPTAYTSASTHTFVVLSLRLAMVSVLVAQRKYERERTKRGRTAGGATNKGLWG